MQIGEILNSKNRRVHSPPYLPVYITSSNLPMVPYYEMTLMLLRI